MRLLNLAFFFAGLGVAMATVAAPPVDAPVAGQLEPRYLRTEYRVDPLGIDAAHPRLSWIVTAQARAQQQSAYQVQVARTPEALAAGTPDLWDSGKVAGAQTNQIGYQGQALASRDRCYWRVRVWDAQDRPSVWSQPALWTMGLLAESDWQADWIGYDQARKDYEANQWDPIWLKGAQWIWSPEPGFDLARKAPVGKRYFRLEFEIPAGAQIVKSDLVATAWDFCDLFVNGEHTDYYRVDQSFSERASYYDVTRQLRPGRNVLAIQCEKLDDNSAAGLAARLRVQTADGGRLEFATDGGWQASADAPDGWNGPDFKPGAPWPQAVVVAEYGSDVFRPVTEAPWLLPPPRYLRREFTLSKPIVRATVTATAQGIYELHLNGQRVSGDYFQPGWTEYNKRILYQTYDVTSLLQPGANAFGAILADGWFAGYVGFGGGVEAKLRDHYGTDLRLRAQMHIVYADGTEEVVGTDRDWRAATGPIVYSDFLQGERYDARKEIPGWDRPRYGAQWNPVDVTESVPVELAAYPTQPVRLVREIRPVAITQPQPGVYIFDMGTNFAGFVRLTVNAPAGTQINLRFGERLWPDGTLYTQNMRSARVIDHYVCKGGGVEVWAPRFTFHGFQYVEVTGLPGAPDAGMLIGEELTSDCPVVGEFQSDDPMANQLYQNIIQTQRANFLDIPTDCPQRDERLGWTGDAQVYIRTATYNNDVAAFFTKWLRTLHASQRAGGEYPVVSPDLVARGAGGTACWSDAAIICPWTVYGVYGDREVLSGYYDQMVRYMDFLRENAGDDLLRPAEGYGDWLSIKADTPKDVLATAYYANNARLMARIAETIGRTEDVARWNSLFDAIKAAFNQAYVQPDGRIKGDTQTCYVIALQFDLLPESLRAQAVDHLVKDIEGRGWHLSTGFIGTKDLMQVLTATGRVDAAYRLFHQETFPGWGFSIRNGATSIWERWDGWTPENGFQTPHMNSFAHYSFGAVAEWMFKVIGGIDSDGPAYRKLTIKPQPGGRIRQAHLRYESINGLIQSDWSIENGRFIFDLTIPANTTATVHVPAGDVAAVTESGQPAAGAEGIEPLGSEAGFAIYAVGSGVYHFEAPAAQPAAAELAR